MENDFNIDPMMRESPDEMRKTLDKNYKNIVDAFIHQSTENYDDSLEYKFPYKIRKFNT